MIWIPVFLTIVISLSISWYIERQDAAEKESADEEEPVTLELRPSVG